MHNSYEFDRVAEQIFAPIYPVIAAEALRCTDITSGRLLDIGCGGGHLGLAVLDAAPELRAVLLDKSPDAVEITEKRIAQRGMQKRAVAVVGAAEQLPLAGGSVDLVVSRGSMPFWDDVPAAFSEILRVLSPTGRAYIGGGMGNAQLAAQIEEKMRVIDPGWPENLPTKARGRSREDYAAVLRRLGAEFELLKDTGGGRWMVFCRGKQEGGSNVGAV